MTRQLFRFRRRVAFLSTTLLTASLLLALLLPTPAFAQDDGLAMLGAEGQAIAQAINETRAANGLGPLVVHSLLNRAAQDHVDDLIRNGMYGHYGSDGSNVRARVLRTGYASGVVSENWVTSGSPQSAMDWWMNDWIHRVNILDTSWDEVGVGAGQVGNGYWIFVTDFANTDGKDTSVAVAPPQAASAASAAPDTIPTEGSDYTIRAGDTLLEIGLRYGMEWQDIALANNIGDSDVLQIGRKIRLPGLDSSGTGGPVAEGGMLYTVRSGDTLSGIAGRYDIGWEEIATANRMGEFSVLQIGMQIRLPGVEEPSTDNAVAVDVQTQDAIAAALATPVSEVAAARVQESAAGGGGSYTVKSGDTLFTIAAKNGLSVDDLSAANSLDEDGYLQIGQQLKVPGSVSSPAAPVVFAATAPAPAGAPASARTYTVKAGDTVIAIALRNNVNWKALLAANGLDDNSLLQPGQVLKVP